ncbi:MAG: hypothetical protein OXB92_11920 [Acidimicrobiaceae bacterium]|nr:hypothetical protein [Acidimicrobiia bacterium]MCY4494552.1 hypothetical protein [Acidimicrobiaceae bacterium]
MDRKARTRETTVNDYLAAALNSKHPRWSVEAESTRVLADHPSKAPDIVVRMPGGMSVILETEYLPAATVESDASGRLGKNLLETGETVEQVVAVRLPESLSRAPQAELAAAIAQEDFDYCLLIGTRPESPDRFPSAGWINGDIDALANLVEAIAVSERQLSQAAGVLEGGVSQAAGTLRELLSENRMSVLDAISLALHQADGEQTSRMAMTIVANALTFHCAVASTHPGIAPFADLRSAGELTPSALLGEWDAILEINYWPIFEIARRVLAPLPADVFRDVVGQLALVAERLVGIGVTTTQEMTGQLFGRLIADRKFLATFYTRPPSAVLLAELAVALLGADFADDDAVKKLKVADLACGTGALLSAVYGRLSARARRGGLDDEELHPTFMEQVLVGADIMPAAVHVTASLLSAVHPSVPFGDTNVHLMPYGQVAGAGHSVAATAIGSLELIDDKEAASLFGTGRTAASGRSVHSVNSKDALVLDHGSSDLVIMNPPFARTVGQEGDRVGIPRPAFAGFGTSEVEQKQMSKRLAEIYRAKRKQPAEKYQGRHPTAGHGHAGLASNFLDLAHAKVKPGGVVAFVLPATFTVSSAWSKARELLSTHYNKIIVVSIAAHGSTDRAFSDDTAMAEVLVVAVRRQGSDGAAGGQNADEADKVLWVGLADRPETVAQSLAAASAILARRVGSHRSAELPGVLRIGDQRLGIVGTGRLEDGGYGQLSELELADTCLGLLDSRLRLPRHEPLPLRVARLGDLGRSGPGNAGIGVKPTSADAVERGTGAYAAPFWIYDLQSGTERWKAASYPALWAHSSRSGRENRLEVLPDAYGEVRPGCTADQGREVWSRAASRVHINLDFRLNSQRLGACLTPRACIGGRAWPSYLVDAPVHELPIVLWLNTTVGLLGRWWVGSRQQQGRSLLSVGRIAEIPVLDCRALSGEQLTDASEVFARFRLREFLPANEAHRDEVRQQLDQAVLCDLLGLPESILDPLDTLREQWCREPTVHGGKRTRPDA